MVVRCQDGRGVSHARRRTRPGGRGLRRYQRGAQCLARDADRRRYVGDCRGLRGRRSHRVATTGHIARLRLRRNHRGVRGSPAPAGHRAGFAVDVRALSWGRVRTGRTAAAVLDYRTVSGNAAVFSAGGGAVHPLSAAAGGARVNVNTWITIAASAVGAATPLAYAALGELVVERTGVLNLGVEGMMLVGAMSGFAAGVTSGSLLLGYLAAAAAGMLIALLFGFLTLTLQTNQVATGLALTLFGVGLSAFAGRAFVGLPITRVPFLHLPLLSDLPVLGPLLFHYDLLVYLSVALCVLIAWVLRATRLGLRIR